MSHENKNKMSHEKKKIKKRGGGGGVIGGNHKKDEDLLHVWRMQNIPRKLPEALNVSKPAGFLARTVT